MFGGAVLLVAGGAACAGVKPAQKDAGRIEEYTGAPVEELSDGKLQNAMDELGVESMEAAHPKARGKGVNHALQYDRK